MNDTSNDTKRRDELLLRMYDQLWTSINSHLLVVWQSIGLVIGAFAILALVEKQIMLLDWAISLIVIISWWMIANLVDASYWYNRNLVIIANIERDFLDKEDEKLISFYFVGHRKNNEMITHYKIQRILGIGIVIVILIYHSLYRVLPAITNKNYSIDLFFPYIIFSIAVIAIIRLTKQRNLSYQNILKNSPGKVI